MEDSRCGYAKQEKRSVARFPCKLARFSSRCSLPLKDPERPWKSSNLSPKPVPSGGPCSPGVMGMSECRLANGFGRPGCVLCATSWARLAPRADGVGEAGDAGGGERAQEFVERPGRVEAGGLLLEGGADGLRVRGGRAGSRRGALLRRRAARMLEAGASSRSKVTAVKRGALRGTPQRGLLAPEPWQGRFRLAQRQ